VSDPAILASLAHKRTQEKGYGSINGTASFFQPGTMSISENGVKNAEAFYRLMRPYEGLPRVFQPSLTAESGCVRACACVWVMGVCVMSVLLCCCVHVCYVFPDIWIGQWAPTSEGPVCVCVCMFL